MRERRRRVFPETFKREAVDRVGTSGLPIVRVAEELGLDETVLRRWITRYGTLASPRRIATPAATPSPADLAAENARLKREPAGRDGARHPEEPSRVAARLCAAGTPRATL
jgi:transposase